MVFRQKGCSVGDFTLTGVGKIVVFEMQKTFEKSAVFLRWGKKPPSRKIGFVGDLMFPEDPLKGSYGT